MSKRNKQVHESIRYHGHEGWLAEHCSQILLLLAVFAVIVFLHSEYTNSCELSRQSEHQQYLHNGWESRSSKGTHCGRRCKKNFEFNTSCFTKSDSSRIHRFNELHNQLQHESYSCISASTRMARAMGERNRATRRRIQSSHHNNANYNDRICGYTCEPSSPAAAPAQPRSTTCSGSAGSRPKNRKRRAIDQHFT